MKEKKKIGLKEAHQSDDTFLSFLEQEAKSAQFKKRRAAVEKVPHPAAEELYNYVLGWLDEEKTAKIGKHISYCAACAKKALTILRIEDETTKELVEWATTPSLLGRLRKFVSEQLLSAQLSAVDAQRAGKKSGNQFSVGDQIIFSVTIPADGYMVVFHGDESGVLKIIFPHGPGEDTSVRQGKEIKVSGAATHPLGKKLFKAIWTARSLLELKGFDLNDEAQVAQALTAFLDSLEDLEKDEWCTVEYAYEVVEE